MALAKENRLQSRQDFRMVFRQGIRRNGPHLTLRALQLKLEVVEEAVHNAIQTVAPTRIGISISTKVSKRAVIRNRIKRQIRAVFRWLLPRISPGWHLVVVVQPSAAQEGCDYQQFLQELEVVGRSRGTQWAFVRKSTMRADLISGI